MSVIKDVAKLAGVSVAAVSKYLKTPENMREETRAKIAAAIVELNYRPNPLAQSLRTGKTNIIAIAIPELDNPYFNRIYNLLQARCEERGLLAILLKNATAEQVKSAANVVRSGLLDGIIYYDEGHLDTFISSGGASVPLVRFGPVSGNDYPATIGIDLQIGIHKLCTHLKETGARRIGYIGPGNNISPAQKIDAISDYCEKEGLEFGPTMIRENCNSYSSGYDCCQELLKSATPLPDAMIVESDMVALGVLKGFHEGGLRVPQDIRISGYDNTDLSLMSNPTLTTVRIPMEEICAAVLKMLCELMEGKTVDPVCFQTDLVIRDSTSA